MEFRLKITVKQLYFAILTVALDLINDIVEFLKLMRAPIDKNILVFTGDERDDKKKVW